MQPDNEAVLTEQLRVKDADERVVVEIGLLATLYFERSWTPDVRASVAACAEAFLARCSDRIRWAKNPKTLRMIPFDPRRGPSPSETLRSFDEEASWELLYHAGKHERAASALSFESLCLDNVDNGLGFLRMSFPLLWFTDHPGSLPEITLEACQRLRPASGYGGIGILESPDSTIRVEFEPAVYAMAQCFPGLEVDYPPIHSVELEEGIKGVNWLTILGEPWLGRVGSTGALRTALDEAFVVRSFDGGVLIQAGPRPLLGDVERGSIPGPYAKLAALLAPVQIKAHASFHHARPDRFERQSSEAWLRRFLRS